MHNAWHSKYLRSESERITKEYDAYQKKFFYFNFL